MSMNRIEASHTGGNLSKGGSWPSQNIIFIIIHCFKKLFFEKCGEDEG